MLYLTQQSLLEIIKKKIPPRNFFNDNHSHYCLVFLRTFHSVVKPVKKDFRVNKAMVFKVIKVITKQRLI